MNNSVFELVENNKEEVIIKVKADNNLVIAKNPYISGEDDYITVTKGRKHILTVIKKDGSTFSFHWGDGGYTLISESLKVLKEKVIAFIETECHIPLELIGTVESARILYNTWYKAWQLTMNDNAHIWSDTATNLEEMKEWVKSYVNVKGWVHSIAPTGIDVWEAVM